jgi:hypothetical protein
VILGQFAVEPMLGIGGGFEESQNSNQYFRLSSTNSGLLILPFEGYLRDDQASTLGISEMCHCFGIILKSSKLRRAQLLALRL